MSLEELIRSIHTLEQHLQKFEEKYKLRSSDFYRLVNEGKLDQSEEFIEWLGIYEIKLKREKSYTRRLADTLTSIPKPIHLPLTEAA
ncbi:MAG: hypothetical protein HZB77_05835 [Chloroflexi bacterium]|nr:hypothetical protein [Chloroflexota bacterium]